MAVTLHEPIGEGGFGRVYRGTDDLGRTVAVKVITRSAAQASSALEHARALARVDHPNVVRIYRVETIADPIDGTTADSVVMEYVAGPTLGQRVASSPLNAQELRRIGTEIINAVGALHEEGVAHRDLHEENVILGTKGVKLIDVLYREQDSLRLLSGSTREHLLAADRDRLRRLLAFAIRGSDLEPGGLADTFLRTATNAEDLEAIADAFRSSVDDGPPSVDFKTPRVLVAYARVTEKGFAAGEPYARALATRNSRDLDAPLLTRLVSRGEYDIKHEHFVRILWERMGPEERVRVAHELAEVLDTTVPDGKYSAHLRFLRTFGRSGWDSLPEITRLRLEYLIREDIQNGRIDGYGIKTFIGGTLGTWANAFGHYFVDQDALVSRIARQLNEGWYTQNYVGKYFMSLLPKIGATPERRRTLVSALQTAVREDAKVVRNNLQRLPKDWRTEVERVISADNAST